MFNLSPIVSGIDTWSVTIELVHPTGGHQIAGESLSRLFVRK